MTVAMEATSTNGYALPILYVCVWRFVFQMSIRIVPKKKGKSNREYLWFDAKQCRQHENCTESCPYRQGGEGGGGSENIHALIFGWGAQMVMSKDLEKAYKNESEVLDPRCEILWWRQVHFRS